MCYCITFRYRHFYVYTFLYTYNIRYKASSDVLHSVSRIRTYMSVSVSDILLFSEGREPIRNERTRRYLNGNILISCLLILEYSVYSRTKHRKRNENINKKLVSQWLISNIILISANDKDSLSLVLSLSQLIKMLACFRA